MEADKLAKMVEDMLRLEINGEKDVENQDQNALPDGSNGVDTVNARDLKRENLPIMENVELRKTLKLH